MGKRRHGSRQDVLLLKENGDVIDIQLDVDVGYVASPDSPEAWGLNRSQQAKNLINGRYVQLITERSGIPVKVFRNGNSENTPIGQGIDVIAKQAEDRAQQESEKDRPKDGRLLWIGIIATIVAIAFLLVIWRTVG